MSGQNIQTPAIPDQPIIQSRFSEGAVGRDQARRDMHPASFGEKMESQEPFFRDPVGRAAIAGQNKFFLAVSRQRRLGAILSTKHDSAGGEAE
jgi:hypothetical protein